MMKNILTAVVLACVMLAGSAYAGDKVNINTASAEQLQSLKGVGEKTAAAIVAYREAHGSFKSIEDLTGVKGIGEKKLAKIADAIEAADVKSEKKDKEEEKHHDQHDD